MTSSTGRAPRDGSLAVAPLPRLLYLLFADRLTGVLRLDLASGPAEVYLVAGQPSAVELPGDVDRLGALLVASGVVGEDRVRRALLAPRAPGYRFGRFLVDGGVIDEAQLRAVLRLQIRRRLHRLFFAPEGRFSVEEEAHGRGFEGREAICVHPLRAIWQGVRSAWDEARFGADVSDKAHRLVAPPELVSAFAFGDPEQALVARLREGPAAAAELGAMPGATPALARALLYALVATEAADLAGAGPRSLRAVVPLPVTDELTFSHRPDLAPNAPAPPPIKVGPARPAITPTGLPPVRTAPTKTPALGVPAAKPAEKTSEKPMAKDDPRRAAPTQGAVPAVPAARANSFAHIPTIGGTGVAISPDALARVLAQKKAEIDVQDYFQVLGVSREADRNEVKTAYLAAARLFHPDRVNQLGLGSLRPDAEHVFRRVSEAYATLADDARRAAYVARLSRTPEQTQAEVDAQRVVAAEMAFMEGEVAWRRRDYKTALDRLGSAMELNPAEGEAVALHAFIRVQAGQARLSDVKPDLERAVHLAPRCARAFHWLGLAQKEEGDAASALNSFRRAAAIDPNLAEAQSELRVLQLRAGKGEGPEKPRSGFFDRLKKK